MLSVHQSGAQSANSSFTESVREHGETNLQWLERHYPQGSDRAVLLLIGGADLISIRLRIAQSQARHDLLPSYWSHVAILKTAARSFRNTQLHEIRLDPPKGFGNPAKENAIQTGRLSAYDDAERYPNIAILKLDAVRSQVESQLRQMRGMRHVVSGVDGLVAWLPYVWGATRAANPLLDEIGIPSAVMAEYALSGAGLDITPGLASRASCPEAIWQTMRWWHEYPGAQRSADAATGAAFAQRLSGFWTTPHSIVRED